MVVAQHRRSLTSAEAAAQYGVTEKTIQRRIVSGELRAYRLRSKGPFRIDQEDLDKLLKPVTTGDSTEAYIDRLVAAAPTLTDDQRSRIAALLRSGGEVS